MWGGVRLRVILKDLLEQACEAALAQPVSGHGMLADFFFVLSVPTTDQSSGTLCVAFTVPGGDVYDARILRETKREALQLCNSLLQTQW